MARQFSQLGIQLMAQTIQLIISFWLAVYMQHTVCMAKVIAIVKS